MREQRANPNSRNYGLGNRDMARAGMNALREGMQSHSSIKTMGDRWRIFAQYARKELGIKDMRQIDTAHLQQYAAILRARMDAGELKASTAHNYLSAVNRVMEIARGDRAVRLAPVQGAGFPERSGVCKTSRAVSQEQHERVSEVVTARVSALMGIQREFGLRFEESAKIDAARALVQAEKHSQVRIIDGTKGGRARIVPIVRQEQLTALRAAAVLQDNHRSMIPPDQSYAQFRGEAYREIQQSGIAFHGQRHHYAQARYQAIVGVPCPVVAGRTKQEQYQHLSRELGITVRAAAELERATRMQVSKELGHGRIDVTSAYLG